MTDEQIKAVFAEHRLNVGDWAKNEVAIGRAVIAAHEAKRQPAQEPVADDLVAWPKTQFTEVSPGLEVGYDLFGGVDIRLGGEFVYVHINYDYRYTHNSARKSLADNIIKLLTEGWPAPQPAVEPLTDGAVSHCINQTLGLGAIPRGRLHELARTVERQCALAWGIEIKAVQPLANVPDSPMGYA